MPRCCRESDAGLLDKLELVERRYLKRAAVLLFHADPERFVTGAFVKIGFFLTDDDLLYQDEIHGDLFTQVEKTLDLLLTKYLKAGISYEGIQRLETFPVARGRRARGGAQRHHPQGLQQRHPDPDQRVCRQARCCWNAGQLPQDWTVEN